MISLLGNIFFEKISLRALVIPSACVLSLSISGAQGAGCILQDNFGLSQFQADCDPFAILPKVEPVPLKPSEPPEPYDPWDYSGIQISVIDPDSLVTTDGKSYQVAAPVNKSIGVYDRPNGNRIGDVFGGREEIRVRYYYIANVHDVWAGMCSERGTCGWAEADYLVRLPRDARDYRMYRVIVPELFAFERPDTNSNIIGTLYDGNLIAVIDKVQSVDGGIWAKACRLESCGWVGAEYLKFEY